MDIENKKNQPPYLSTTRLEKVIEIITNRNLREITAKYFRDCQFSEADAYLAIATLRFLGVLDEKGKVVEEKIRSFQLKGEERTKKVLEIVKNSYQPLFERASEIYNFSLDDLHNEFVHLYNLTPRVATPSVRNFLWFCELVGLREKSIKAVERPRSNDGLSKIKSKTNKSLPVVRSSREIKDERSSSYSTSGATTFKYNDVILLIPNEKFNLTQSIIDGALKDVLEKVQSLSEKYSIVAESPTVEVQNNDEQEL